MKRAFLMSIYIGAVALSAGCGRRDAAEADKKDIIDLATRPASAGSIAPVEVVGCLTASGDRFVVTHVDKDNSKTVAYELAKQEDQLRALIGKEVRVTGEAQPTQKVETHEVTPPRPAATSGAADAKAQVSTVENTKVDMQKLTVASVSPTGDSCPR